VSRTTVHTDHRVQGIPDQVQNDLLELNTISDDQHRFTGKLRAQVDPASQQVSGNKREDFSNGLVQIYGFGRGGFFGEESAQSRDHIRRAVAVADRATRRFARALDVRRLRGPSCACQDRPSRQ
jgi:hypothetical protein